MCGIKVGFRCVLKVTKGKYDFDSSAHLRATFGAVPYGHVTSKSDLQF